MQDKIESTDEVLENGLLGTSQEHAKPSKIMVMSEVYQYQLADGSWIDQTKDSHEYNVRHGQATVRVLYEMQ